MPLEIPSSSQGRSVVINPEMYKVIFLLFIQPNISWGSSKRGLDEKTRLVEDRAWYMTGFLVHQHWGVEDGNGHGRDLRVGKLPLLCGEWGLMGGDTVSKVERGGLYFPLIPGTEL